MKFDSDKKFPPVPVGSTVRVPIPDVDKGRGDSRNILAIVMNVTEDGFYRIGTTQGILKQLYARSQFTVCRKNFISMKDVPNQSAAISQSNGSGQGFVRCHCKRKCKTNICHCLKRKLKCTSKCHDSLSCFNK